MPTGNPGQPKPSLQKITDADFVEMFERDGATKMAEHVGMDKGTLFRRRRRIEQREGIIIDSPSPSDDPRFQLLHRREEYPQRVSLEIEDGIVLVGSDMHYWPGDVSTAHRGLVALAKALKPKAIIANGDVIDGSTISRHPPIGWETRPLLVDEIEAATERLSELESAAPKALRIWPLGNHDARFETRLAMVAPEYAQIYGVHLRDHFPGWEPCWSCWINDNVVVKHRFKGGTHAAHNNALWAGKTIVTGHLHSLKVTPITDYNGIRWGAETGTLANPDGPQFVDYTEDNPKNWVSGFVALEFYKGKLLWPEIAYVFDKDHIAFRGDVIKV